MTVVKKSTLGEAASVIELPNTIVNQPLKRSVIACKSNLMLLQNEERDTTKMRPNY